MTSISVEQYIELHSYSLADAPTLFALIDKNRKHLRTWLTWVDAHTTVASSENFIKKSLEEEYEKTGYCFGIFLKDELVGNVSLNFLSMQHRKTNIAYWISKDFEGQGITTKALQALISFAFQGLGLNRVEILVATENAKSRAIPEFFGFKLEGIRREDCWLYDYFVDQAIYSKLAEEN